MPRRLPGLPVAIGWLTLPCRLVLGGLFVFAGVLKLMSPQDFANAIAGFKIFTGEREHFIPFLTYAIPWTEVVAGFLLVIGAWTRSAALILSLMLAAFIAGILGVIFRGLDTKCSCFGKIEWPCSAINPNGGVGWCQIVRNVIMIAMAVPIFKWGPGPLAVEKESQA